jgi:hypothetical protein
MGSPQSRRGRREKMFCLSGDTDRQNVLRPPPKGWLLKKVGELMENRHLPILHKDSLLRDLCVSNESQLELRPNWDEWAVRF